MKTQIDSIIKCELDTIKHNISKLNEAIANSNLHNEFDYSKFNWVVVVLIVVIIGNIIFKYIGDKEFKLKIKENFHTELLSALFGFTTGGIVFLILKDIFLKDIPHNFPINTLAIIVTLATWASFSLTLSVVAKYIINVVNKSQINVNRNYKAYFDVIFNNDSSDLKDKLTYLLVKDYHIKAHSDIYVLSVETYLDLLEEFLNDGYSLIGINSVSPPDWYSAKPEYSTVSRYLDNFKKLGKEKKKKHQRLTYFPYEWSGNLFNATFKNHCDENKLNAYLWFLNIISNPNFDMDINLYKKYLISDIPHNKEILRNTDFIFSRNSISEKIKSAYRNIRDNSYKLSLDNECDKIIEDTAFTEQLNKTILSDFLDILGDESNFCTQSELYSILDFVWTEIGIFQKNNICFGFSTLSTINNSKESSIQLKILDQKKTIEVLDHLKEKYFHADYLLTNEHKFANKSKV